MDLSANFQSVFMRKVLLVLSFFISTAFALAQQPPAAYLKAKSDLDAKAYGMAKDGFVAFLDETKYGVLSAVPGEDIIRCALFLQDYFSLSGLLIKTSACSGSSNPIMRLPQSINCLLSFTGTSKSFASTLIGKSDATSRTKSNSP